ncbi:MAG: cytochrome c oxidase subunit II [Polyangiaceae bacterium]|nr:cytochrome c oxidase subunit II [Polyangiaceae bacterium]
MMNPQGTTQLPPQLSTFAAEVDRLYYLIYWVSVVSFVLITGFMVYYVVKYRRRPGLKAEPTGHSTVLEIAWTFSPLIFLAYLFHAGFQGYMAGAVAPVDSLEIRVRAMQWNWEFEYPNGMTTLNELTVPAGQPVKLIMSSSDVLHSFFVPEFRIKRDVVPGMYTTIWFEAPNETPADKPIVVFCAEYCGAPLGIADGTVATGMNSNHSTMLANLRVVSREAFDTLMQEGPPAPAQCQNADNPAVCWGQDIHNKVCKSCHSVDPGVNAPGPSWATLWGAERSFEDGGSVTADENYIRESILQPGQHIVKGYAGVNMPPFRLPERQIDAVIAYMRSLQGE